MEVALIQAHDVPPKEIEQELTRIWDSLEKTKMWRASLFNLIIYSQKDERSEYILTLAKKIIEKFPARVLFVVVDPDKDPQYMKTRVSVLTTSEVRKDIACDYIEITVGEKGQKVVPYLILPQLLSDLPVYLVWTQDICKETALSRDLEKLTNRLILDSETTNDLPCFASTALQHYDATRCDIADLNWARMESWRDLLSSTFYPPDQLQQLKKTQTISITYNSSPSPYFCHTEVQAIYLQAWLATRLDWQFQGKKKENSHLTFNYLREDNPLSITLTPSLHPTLSPGNITAMTIHTIDGVQFAFNRHLSFPHQISLEITTPEECFLPTQFVFAKGEAGGSLVKEVSHRGTSNHYLNVLKLVSNYDIRTKI